MSFARVSNASSRGSKASARGKVKLFGKSSNDHALVGEEERGYIDSPLLKLPGAVPKRRPTDGPLMLTSAPNMSLPIGNKSED